MRTFSMVGEMVQNSQSLYSFTFNVLIDIHEYIHLHSTTEFTFKKYIYSHLAVYFLFTIIFAHIYEMYHSHSTSYIHSHSRSKYSFSIFCAPPLRISQCKTWTVDYGLRTTDYGLRTTDYGLRTTDYGLRTTDYGLRTTDYGLGIKHGLRYKRRTKHYGLGIKYGLRYKMRTVRYGLGIKHEERLPLIQV